MKVPEPMTAAEKRAKAGGVAAGDQLRDGAVEHGGGAMEDDAEQRQENEAAAWGA